MHANDIIQRANSLVETHRNPIKKLELPGSKLFLPTGSDEEAELVKNTLSALRKVLDCEQVERRCARSVAKWLPEHKLAEVSKGGGILQNFGFANKKGRFLYPEEALFLLEVNRLELQWNDVPLSIQQAYEIVLNDMEYTMQKYLAYRKLALQGFRLMRTAHVSKNENKEPVLKKRRLCESPEDVTSHTSSKQINTDKQEAVCNRCSETSTEPNKTDAETENAETDTNKVQDTTREIFKKLQEEGPKKLETRVKRDSDYKVFLPESSSRICPDFELRICNRKYIDPTMGFMDDKVPAIVGFSSSEFCGYFRIERVELPELIYAGSTEISAE